MHAIAELPLRRHRIDVGTFHRMAEAGILTEDDRVELIDGDIVDMTPIGSRHASTVNLIAETLVRALHGRAIVSIQNPIVLDRSSEPQPDIACLRPDPVYYRDRLPAAPDVLWLIEVADSSLAYDREVKLPLYARSGIAEVWLVDLEAGRIERWDGPSAEGFRRMERQAPRGGISPRALPEITLQVADLLGGA